MPEAMEQKRVYTYFWIALSCLILLNLGVFVYFSHAISVTKAEWTQKAIEIQGAALATNKQVQSTAMELESTKERLSSTDKQVKTVHDLIQSETDELKKQGLQLSTLDTFKVDSEKKLTNLKDTVDKSAADLNQRLKDIQVSGTDFSGIIEDAVKSVVGVQSTTGSGSGVVIDDDGHILTNSHVIDSATSASVIDYNGKAYTATVIKRDATKDLLLLKINTGLLPKLIMGNSGSMRVGEKVLAIGNPAGLQFSVTEGIISALDRKIDDSGVLFMQTDTSINPGNSGGPLLNTQGEVIGIIAKKYANYEGLGFTIPIQVAKDFLQS